jgi:hypothetical protein
MMLRRALLDPPTRRDVLIDALSDAYTAWRQECKWVEAAYARWLDAEPRGRRFAFLAYCAALDREEAAARVYESRTNHLVREALDAQAA